MNGITYTELKKLLGAQLGDVRVEDSLVSPVYGYDLKTVMGVITYYTPDGFNWDDADAVENIDYDSLYVSDTETFN